MPEAKRARATRAVAVAAALLAAASLVPSAAAAQVGPTTTTTTTTTPTDPNRPGGPLQTPGIDPVLDAVPVDETPAIRQADEDLEASAAGQDVATQRWIQAAQRRTAFAGKAGSAAQVAAEARHQLDEARAVQTAVVSELARRRAREQRLRAVADERRGEVREVAAHLFATGTDDRYAVLGSFTDVSKAERRDALRDRGTDLQLDRFESARKPWARAKGARQAQERRLTRVQQAVASAKQEAQRTAHERDQFDQLVAAADQGVAEAIAGMDAARAKTQAVVVERRKARLVSTVQDLDLPLVALHAYWRSSALAPCRIPWWVVAGVGRIESRHGSAAGSHLTAEGDTTVHILGIPLDGRPGTIAIRDTDGGLLDGDPVWDRAVGPMQFIPGTWGRWASDDNVDGKADPHNIYDAAGAAAKYLCYSRGDLDTDAKIRGALLAYNNSNAYVGEVLQAGGRYRDALDLPDVPGDRGALPTGATTTTTPGG